MDEQTKIEELEKHLTKVMERYKPVVEQFLQDMGMKGGIADTDEVMAALCFFVEWYKKHLWHKTKDNPDEDKLFVLVAPNKNTSLALWGGKKLLTCTLAGGHNVLGEDDIWAYLEDLLPDII